VKTPIAQDISLPDLLKASLWLGLSAGSIEFFLRTEPRLGLGFFDQLLFSVMAMGSNLAVALLAAGVAALTTKLPYLGKRKIGFVVGSLLGLHIALYYRFAVSLNESLRNPMLLLGLAALFGMGMLVGVTFNKHIAPRVKWAGLLGLLCFWGGFIKGMPVGPDQTSDGPNVLLITWDTTRPDRLQPYGGPAKTPVLQRLADEGARFEQAIAPAPLTEPSHLALLTGNRTTTTGVLSNGTKIGEQPAMIQWSFQQMDARTGAVVSGFPLHGRYGWSEGWDVYDDDFGSVPAMHRLTLVKLADEFLLPANTLRERKGDSAVDRSLRFLKQHERGRWFLWVHFFDPHAPYEVSDLASAPTDGEPLDLPGYWPPPHKRITSTDWLTQAYDDELAYTDQLTGELISWLEVHALLENTLVVMTADHGESLTEHGVLFDHGDDLYDPSLRVPLILRGPGVEPGTVVPCQLSTIDVIPTIRQLAVLPAYESDGAPFTEWLQGTMCSDRPVLSSTIGARFVEEPPVDLSLRTPEAKYIRMGQDRGVRLYDLIQDPDESRDFSAERPEDVDLLADRMDAVLDGKEVIIKGPEMDAQTLEALRALGYVED
jgi:arylsulfatase A-like enzyme